MTYFDVGCKLKILLKKRFKIMLEFKSAIVDECGCVVYWCENLTDNEIDEILTKYPEYRIACIEC
jgi:hypothetical protein